MTQAQIGKIEKKEMIIIEPNIDYRKLLPTCIPHMLKRELREAAATVGLHENNAALHDMKAETLRNFIIQNATLEQAEAIRKLFPKHFLLSCKEANQIFGYNLTTGQVEYLARHNRLRGVGGSRLNCSLYAPEGFYVLTPEDLSCPDSPDWVNQQTLIKSFGWTKALIRRFLSEPKLVTNPRYRTAPEMKLWPILKIEAIMASPEFLDAVERANFAKVAAKKGSEVRLRLAAAEAEERIKSIQVEVIPDEELRQKALDTAQKQLDAFAMESGAAPGIAREADEDTLHRWIVGYILENLTTHECDFCGHKGKPRSILDYEAYRNAVLDKIAEAYPAYAGECQRRKDIPL